MDLAYLLPHLHHREMSGDMTDAPHRGWTTVLGHLTAAVPSGALDVADRR